MTRPVEEWIGAKPESRIPARVRVRAFQSQDGRCAECGKKMAVCGEPFEVDHITALVLGGENRESNLRALCAPCHRSKTRQDVAQKSTEARKRAKHLGLKQPKRKIPYRRADGQIMWNGKP
jgi:5-methylcytosine-specific restriction endonuclease McrA